MASARRLFFVDSSTYMTFLDIILIYMVLLVLVRLPVVNAMARTANAIHPCTVCMLRSQATLQDRRGKLRLESSSLCCFDP